MPTIALNSLKDWNYDHWCGYVGSSWGYFNKYSSGGMSGYYGYTSGKHFVWLVRLTMPTVSQGKTISSISILTLNIHGWRNTTAGGSTIAYLTTAHAGEDTPATWKTYAKNNGIAASNAVANDNSYVRSYSFTGVDLTPGATYYVVFCGLEDTTHNAFEYQFSAANGGIPGIYIHIATQQYSIQYHDFNNNLSSVDTQIVSPGQQKVLSKSLKDSFISDKKYFFRNWNTAEVSQSTPIKKRESGKEYNEGQSYNIQESLRLYPVGAEPINLTEKPYFENVYPLNTTQYALEAGSNSTKYTYGTGFWIDYAECNQSLGYVYQGNKWYLMGSYLRPQSDAADYRKQFPAVTQAYKFSFIGRSDKQLYSNTSTIYRVPITFLDSKAIDLFPNDRYSNYTWEQLANTIGYENNYNRVEEVNRAFAAGTNAPLPSALLGGSNPLAQEFDFPVFKFNLRTFDWALNENAYYGKVDSTIKRWFLSSSSKTMREHFAHDGLFLGMMISKEFGEKVRSVSTIEAIDSAFTVCSSGFAATGGALPQDTPLRDISVSTWKALNSGNGYSSLNIGSWNEIPANDYVAVLGIDDDITLDFEGVTYDVTYNNQAISLSGTLPLRVRWINQTPYIFYGRGNQAEGRTWAIIDNTVYGSLQNLLNGFTGFAFEEKQYGSLKDLFTQAAQQLCENYVQDLPNKITIKAGDTNGFAYITNTDGSIGQYYIYKSNGDGTAIRLTPYVKKIGNTASKCIQNVLGVNFK